MSSKVAIGGLYIVSRVRGRNALSVLKNFAPPSVHDYLMAQDPYNPALYTEYPYSPFKLGIVGNYEWELMADRNKALGLLVGRRNAEKLMSIAEALRVEQAAIRRSHATDPSVRRKVIVVPYDIQPETFSAQVDGNIRRNRHWSYGLR